MKLARSEEEIIELIERQLGSLFFYSKSNDHNGLVSAIKAALAKCEVIFLASRNAYHQREGTAFFNPTHSAQNTIFLYWVSHLLWKDYSRADLAEQVYCLNKMLNGLDLFYEVEMPEIFALDHPVGSVIGRGSFSDYFFFTQGCTIGNNKGVYPKIGKNVSLLANATVIGASHIGDHSVVSANTYIKDEIIPEGSLVFGQSPQLTIRTVGVDNIINNHSRWKME